VRLNCRMLGKQIYKADHVAHGFQAATAAANAIPVRESIAE